MARGLVVAILLMSRAAWADDPLVQARTAVAGSDYASARAPLAAALAAGTHSPDELVEIYQLSGTVAAALGDAKAATDAFTSLLALSPKATLPPGTSPKIRRPFEAAGRYFTTHRPLELRLETNARSIALIQVSDPLAMVARARVVFSVDGGAPRTQEAAALERTELALPPGVRIVARVAALDRYGNRLVELGSDAEPIVIAGVPPVVRAAPPSETAPVSSAPLPVYRRWWPYAAATGVFAGATAYFALSARSASHDLEALNADSPNHSFAEAKDVENRAKRRVLLTNVGLGVTAVFAVTAGVMFALTPRERFEPQLSAAPVPGGAAVVFGGHF